MLRRPIETAALTGHRESSQSYMSGYPTNRELDFAADPDDPIRQYRGSLQFCPSENSLGTRSRLQILFPARFGDAEKCLFLSAK